MTSWKGSPFLFVAPALALSLALSLALAPAAQAANPQIVPCPPPNQSLLEIPEIPRSADGKLRATIEIVDGLRLIADTNTTRCATQHLRYLRGYQGFDAAKAAAWPTGNDPLPGPTLRARVGDLVELAFFNDIDLINFAAELDKGAAGTTAACDQFTTSTTTGPGGSTTGTFSGDKMPNCLHGSSTSNIHFHGTHTTPSTTGDNVLIFLRPSMEVGGERQPSRAAANANFAQVFSRCEQEGPPKQWTQLPATWQGLQKDLVEQYDRTAVFQGQPGALPADSRLTPANDKAIGKYGWPQYMIGAAPYCFPLPAYDAGNVRMGQAPGTHWYHAHKHGSTALNVANGLVGAFVIEGQYDDQLRAYYGPGFKDPVLMVQQLASTPVTTAANVRVSPALSVNGRLVPVLTMRPGEVQQWRMVNASFNDAFEISYSEAQATKPCAAATPPPSSPLEWRQIAQDGVQFDVKNYQTLGSVNGPLNVAPGNRADLLVKAPARAGNYTLCVRRNIAIFAQPGSPVMPSPPSALLTVKVTGSPAGMDFIPDDRFPTLPAFLADIPESDIRLRRKLTFSGLTNIDGKPFEEGKVSQTMQLNTAEEWTVENTSSFGGHPFHIHVNPFQLTELFEPNSPEATTPGNPCYVDPKNPATFKPCPTRQPQPPFTWWDTFAIPTAQVHTLTTCTVKEQCPKELQPYITSCDARGCVETIPGYFKMRSRFVDYTGDFVLHCHILLHEDRGMMQLVRVSTDTTELGHH